MNILKTIRLHLAEEVSRFVDIVSDCYFEFNFNRPFVFRSMEKIAYRKKFVWIAGRSCTVFMSSTIA